MMIPPNPDCINMLEDARMLYLQNKLRAAEQILNLLYQQYPDNVDICILMSRVKESRGMLFEQISYLEKARSQDTEKSEIHMRLAFAYLSRGRFDDASTSAQQAIECPDVTADIFHSCAKIYHAVGQHDLSAQLLARSIANGADSDQVYYDYGMALTLSGKIAQAHKAYLDCIARNPEFGMAYAGLSKVRKASPENNNTKILTSLVKQQRNPWVAINLHHGLAKELDDLGDYDNAFKQLKQGKKRLKLSCPHSPSACVDNLIATQQLYRERMTDIIATSPVTSLKSESAQPIFVTGMPRTGTTIVERILTNHEDVESLGERLQFSMQVKKQCDQDYSGLLDASTVARNWDHIDFDQVGIDYLQSVQFLRTGQNRFVDKLPLNILLAGIILRALPEAKIVCLIRDPLDTLIGNYRQVFEYSSATYTYTLDLISCAQFIVEFNRLATWLAELFPQRFIIVEYEKLVSHPHEQGKRLLDACSLSWDPQCIDIHKNEAVVGTASAAQVKVPIHQKSIGHSAHYLACLAEAKALFQRELSHSGNP
jgi:tetratricopeptide (TPR) repeat protein